MAFTYKTKGIELDMTDMAAIHEYYEAASTAEYLMENYDVKDESEALEFGYMVRETMDRYGLSEIDAIDHLRDKGVF